MKETNISVKEQHARQLLHHKKIKRKKTIILLLDNFVTLSECKQLIKLYNQHKHLASEWLGSYLLDSSQISHPLIKDILKRSKEVVQKYFNSKLVVELAQVKWHTKGSHHPLHYDLSRSTTVLASVTYLNTTSSGQTIFEDGLQVMPKAGRMIIFDGKQYLHGINTCLTNRYAIPMWYKYS